MSIYRTKRDKTNPYVMVNKAWVNDPSLSAKAKGILLYLLSKPDDWRVREADIISHMLDGRDSIRSAVKELVAAGYVVRSQLTTTHGRFSEVEYDVHEVSVFRAPSSQYLVVSDSPSTEKPSTVEMRGNSQFADSTHLGKLMDQAKADRRQQ